VPSNDDDNDSLSSRALRRARIDLIFTEYEVGSCSDTSACCRVFISCDDLWLPSPPLDNIQVMVIAWRLRGNIIRTAPCWVVWHNVHSQQHSYMSSSYRSSRLGLSHWDPYTVRRGGCLELYYCNMVEWSCWDSGLIWKINWLPSVLWHCWFGHM